MSGSFDRMAVVMRWLAALGITSMIMFLPLAKGGNTDWARGVAVLVVPLLFALNWPILAARNREIEQGIWPWSLVWMTVSLCVVVQIWPGLGSSLGTPLSAPCNDGGGCENQLLSQYPIVTASHWAMFSIYWMVAWMISRMAFGQIKLLVSIVTLLALFEAVYGIFSFIGGQETILGIWQKEHYLGDVTGTFVNRNHFSGFLELSWPLALSLILLPKNRGGFRWSDKVRYLLIGLFSFFAGLAILNSHSRLGTISAIAGLIVWTMVVRRNSDDDEGVDAPRWMGRAAIVVALLGGLWFGMETLIERYTNLLDSEGRLVIWSSMMDLHLSTWLTGVGAGAFIDVFRTVQPPGMEPLFNYAHSDLLEFFLDFGLIGASLILLATVFWVRRVLPKKLSLLQIGALGGISAIFVHSFGDFNLHISGVALLFWTAVGILVNPHLRQERHRIRSRAVTKE